jgi:hypothetical protein
MEDLKIMFGTHKEDNIAYDESTMPPIGESFRDSDGKIAFYVFDPETGEHFLFTLQNLQISALTPEEFLGL